MIGEKHFTKRQSASLRKIAASAAGCAVFLIFACDTSPYRPVEDWTDKDMQAIGHYYSSIRASNEYLRIIKQAGGPNVKLTDKELADLRKYAKLAADEARLFLIYPETMDKMHPEMQIRFRDEYLRSLDLTVMGMDYRDDGSVRAGDKLYNSFVDWFKENREKIRFPRGA